MTAGNREIRDKDKLRCINPLVLDYPSIMKVFEIPICEKVKHSLNLQGVDAYSSEERKSSTFTHARESRLKDEYLALRG